MTSPISYSSNSLVVLLIQFGGVPQMWYHLHLSSHYLWILSSWGTIGAIPQSNTMESHPLQTTSSPACPIPWISTLWRSIGVVPQLIVESCISWNHLPFSISMSVESLFSRIHWSSLGFQLLGSTILVDQSGSGSTEITVSSNFFVLWGFLAYHISHQIPTIGYNSSALDNLIPPLDPLGWAFWTPWGTNTVCHGSPDAVEICN